MTKPVKPHYDPSPKTAFLEELIEKSSNVELGDPGEVLDTNRLGAYPEQASRQSSSSVQISYKRLAKPKDFKAEYIALHIPNSASTIRFSIKHSLGRIPKGYIVLQIVGLETTTGGRRHTVSSLSPDTNPEKNYWSNTEITFRWAKTSSDAHNTRILLMVY